MEAGTAFPSKSSPEAEIWQIYATGRADGVTIRDESWRRLLLLNTDPNSPSLVSTIIALNAFYAVNRGEARQFLKDNCQATADTTKSGPFLDIFVREHFSETYGGFRYHKKETLPSIYGTAWATTVFSWAWEILPHPVNLPRWAPILGSLPGSGPERHQRAEKLFEFVGHCVWRWSGMKAFAEFPGGKPSIPTTHGATDLLKKSWVWAGNRPFAVPDDLKNFSDLAAGIVEFIAACIKQGGGGSYGLANHPDEAAPQSDATYYGLDLLRILQEQADGAGLSQLSEKIDDILRGKREEIARFLGSCRKDGGFAKFEHEKPSIIYSDLALWCLSKHIYPRQPAQIEKIMPYEELSEGLRNYINSGKLGFVAGSPQNIFAIKAATSIVSLLSEVYPEEARRDQEKLNSLKDTLTKAIFQHQVPGTPFFTAYRYDP